jgi:anti-anti-sigma regulatory factor
MMTLQNRLDETSVVHLDGPLRMPVGDRLRRRIQVLLRCGARLIVLDLSRVTDIDAAGIGELIRAYNLTIAANGVLRVTRVPARIRDLLVRVGLSDPLGDDREPLSEEQDAVPTTVRKG